MALTSTARGSGSHGTTTTSWVITPASYPAAGSLLVLVVAYDNSGGGGADPYSSITDSQGNTWTPRHNTLRDPGSASAGCVLRIFTTRQNAGTLVSPNTITITLGTTTVAKAWALWEITAASGYYADYLSTGTGTGGTGNPTVTTGTISVGDMTIGGIAYEYGEAPATVDTDTTNGSWSSAQSANVGSTTSGMSVSSQYKLQTTTGSTQTFNHTRTNSSDYAAGWISVDEINLLQTVTVGLVNGGVAIYALTASKPDPKTATLPLVNSAYPTYASVVIADGATALYMLGAKDGARTTSDLMVDELGNHSDYYRNANAAVGAGLHTGAADESTYFHGANLDLADSAWWMGANMTVECWADVASSPDYYRMLAGTRDDAAKTQLYILQLSGSSTFEIRLTNNAGTNWDKSPSISAGIHHIVARLTGGTSYQVFIDGTEYGSATTVSGTFDDATTSQATRIANDPYGFEYVGRLQAVAFYNSSLSTSAITNHYNLGTGTFLGQQPFSVIRSGWPLNGWFFTAAVREVGTGASGTSTSISASIPAGALANDFLFLYHLFDTSGGADTGTTPSGWTQQSPAWYGNLKLVTYYRNHNGSDTTVDPSTTVSTFQRAVVIAFTNGNHPTIFPGNGSWLPDAGSGTSGQVRQQIANFPTYLETFPTTALGIAGSDAISEDPSQTVLFDSGAATMRLKVVHGPSFKSPNIPSDVPGFVASWSTSQAWVSARGFVNNPAATQTATLFLPLVDGGAAPYDLTATRAVATQTITLTAVLDGDATIYQPTVPPPTAPVTVGLIDGGATAYQLTLIPKNTLTVALVDGGAATYDPKVNFTLALPLVDGAAAIYQLTLTPKNTLTVALVDGGATAYQPTVTPKNTLTVALVDGGAATFQLTVHFTLILPLVDGGAAVYNLTAQPDQFLIPDLADGAATPYDLTVTRLGGGAPKDVILDLVDEGAGIYDLTVLPQPITAYVDLADGGAAIYALAVGFTVSLPTGDGVAAIYTLTVTPKNTLTVGLVDGAAAIYQLAAGFMLTLPLVDASAAIFAPTVPPPTAPVVLPLVDGGAAIYVLTVTPISTLVVALVDGGAAIYALTVTPISTFGPDLIDGSATIYALVATKIGGFLFVELALLDGAGSAFSITVANVLATISGYTRNQYGAIIPSCTVDLFRSSDNEYMGTTTSDALGHYLIGAAIGVEHFLVAYSTAKVYGVTARDIVGV